jgi:transcriptional/translational regulatory protein YebC/TACO1
VVLQGKADAKKSKIYGKIGKKIISVVKSAGPGEIRPGS